MSDDLWAQLIAAAVGAAITVLWRLVDRYLPDPEGRHPLPKRPTNADPSAGLDE